MSVETMALVLHHSRAKGTAKLVLLGIANHDGDGGAWPTVEKLARYANVTERNVQKALGQLVQLGELHVHVQAGGDHRCRDTQRPNRYDVLVTCPQTCDRTKNHKLRELPRSQADLWTNGVSDSTPGVASDAGGVSDSTGGGVSLPTPKPSIETTPEHHSSYVAQPQTARATCSVCSLPEAECQRRASTSGHDFVPVERSGRAQLEAVRHHYGPGGVAAS